MHSSEPIPPPRSDDAELEEVREALRGLQYGYVNIVVQDGVIVQIDRTEKRRLRAGRPSAPPSP